ncbi:MAG: phosphate acetyltransferase [candidate division Zixibacteria bacterium]|nr:phosphate acetyltransferase [candidate division Zixibacteria bacterium]
MSILDNIKDKAKAIGRTVVLPEGYDERTIIAAKSIIEQNLCKVIILGKTDEINKLAGTHGLETSKVTVIQPENAPDFDEFAELLFERRKAKGMTLEKAKNLMKTELYYGAAMVKTGKADASVAGAVNTTGNVLRAALQVIGLAEGINTLSSCFLMTLPEFLGEKDKTFMFGDCAVLPNPNAEQLASIAASTAETYQKLVGDEPRVAFLSFSTKGSAKHADVNKVLEALEIFKKQHPEIQADGEMQLDAAVMPKIGAKKAPDSTVAGKANVLIFPDLDAGNIGYKLTQRFAGAIATGPIIQGLEVPANDLSRGCSADDIVDVSAIAVLMKG